MKPKKNLFLLRISGLFLTTATAWFASSNRNLAVRFAKPAPKLQRYLFAATPGIRNYLGYGPHGIQVFDIDNNHRFVKFIKTAGLGKNGKPSNVKGIDVSLTTNCLYISTLEALQCIDLTTEKIMWEKPYESKAIDAGD